MTKKERMYDMVQQWKDSGLSMTKFSQRQGITLRKLRYWADKFKETELSQEADSDEGSFVPMTIKAPPVDNNLVKITYPNGVQLELDQLTLQSNLSKLIKLY